MTRGMLDGVEAFLRVAERRSFSAAAADLGVTPSAVSQTIRALEDRVGVPLLMRTTRSVGLTQAGELFLERAGPALDGVGAAFQAARNLGGRPAGLLRINVARAVVHHLVEPLLAGFCEAYPDIELEFFAEDKFIDITAGGFDAGIRLGESLDADMVAVRLTDSVGFTVVGTPSYFQKYGRPLHPVDLAAHKCIRIRMPNGSMMPWTFVQDGRDYDVAVTGPVIVNDFNASMSAAGTGVALMYMAQPNVAAAVQAGRLEAVLSSYGAQSDGLFLYYPERRQVMPKLRAFIDYTRANLPPAKLLAG